tara:strand:- start:406 stop:822 length:417 start_codon:yes stop_codon:yes gene_type:complete
MSDLRKTSLKATVSREEVAHTANSRPKRVPMRDAGQLDYKIREGYTGFWEIDQPGKLTAREAAGWSFILDGDDQKETRTCLNGDVLYLMESPTEFVEEDEAYNQAQDDLIMKQINSLKSGQYVGKSQNEAVQRKVNYR